VWIYGEGGLATTEPVLQIPSVIYGFNPINIISQEKRRDRERESQFMVK